MTARRSRSTRFNGRALTTALAVLCAAALPAASQLPSPVLPVPDHPPAFSDYPATEGVGEYAPTFVVPRVSGTEQGEILQWLDLQGPPSAHAPNFSGRYLIRVRGCGTECQAIALADLRTGVVQFPAANAASGVHFEPGSRLLRLNDPEYESLRCTGYGTGRGGVVTYLALESGRLQQVHRSEFPCP
jgi:hypothetical protein